MICDLKDGQGIDLNAQVTKWLPQKQVSTGKVQSVLLKDPTGEIWADVWDQHEVRVVGMVEIKKARCVFDDYRKKLKLQVGRYSLFFFETKPPTEEQLEELMNKTDGLSKENVLKIMDEIIRYMRDKRAEIAEM